MGRLDAVMVRNIIPWRVVEPDEYEDAVKLLTAIALAFEAGGWDFMQACEEAKQAVVSERD